MLWDGVKQINAEELENLLENKPEKVEIIDVREPAEWEAGHIPGITFMPMGTIPEKLDSFDPAKEYVFVCRSGNRSQQVCKYLQYHGLEKVTNYEGGMLVWEGKIETGS